MYYGPTLIENKKFCFITFFGDILVNLSKNNNKKCFLIVVFGLLKYNQWIFFKTFYILQKNACLYFSIFTFFLLNNLLESFIYKNIIQFFFRFSNVTVQLTPLTVIIPPLTMKERQGRKDNSQIKLERQLDVREQLVTGQ